MRPNVSLHAAYLNQLDIYNRITDYASDVPFHPVSLSLPTHHHHEHYPEKIYRSFYFMFLATYYLATSRQLVKVNEYLRLQ